MHIRTASAAEMLALWGENPDHPSPTARFNCENIESGIAIDEVKYAVFYEIFASNIMPEITVVERRAAP